jgi:hypothetical protein
MADAFETADRAIDQAAKGIAAELKKLLDLDIEPVSMTYRLEGLLLALLEDHDGLALFDKFYVQPGPATIKLSNALADWRDARFQDR